MHKLEILDTATSTMDAARQRLRLNAVEFADGRPSPFSGLLAREQTRGRGQRGRAWSARAGSSLCVTYYLRHGLALPGDLGAVALLAGVAVAAAVRRSVTAARSDADIGLKWPNDLLLNGNKAGGILIETATAGDGAAAALIGVGINLAADAFSAEDLPFAAALASAGVPPEPVSLGVEIAAALEHEAALFKAAGLAPLVQRWRELDRTAGRGYYAEIDGAEIHGTAAGIDETGRLILLTPGGRRAAVSSASTLRESS